MKNTKCLIQFKRRFGGCHLGQHDSLHSRAALVLGLGFSAYGGMQDGRGEGHLGQRDRLHSRAALVLGSSSAKLMHMDVE